MEPEEAIKLLDQVAQNFTGTRNDHIRLQLALEALKSLIPKKPTPKNSK